MYRRILYCASTASHILNFHLPYLKFFKEQGWQVDVAVGSKTEIPYADKVIELPLKKSLFAFSNLRAVHEVQKLLDENRYDLISLHTTLAGAIVRLAVRMKGKQSETVVYTTHGYFFNGEGGLREWPYLWVEKLLASVTDVLMVMNSVDHHLAVQNKLGKKVVFIPGMGLNLDKFSNVDKRNRKRLKMALGFSSDDFLIVYAAEMSKRKNQEELIRAFAMAAAQGPTFKLLLAGDGALKNQYYEMVQKYGLSERVHFLGHVSNMAALYEICDVAASTSRSEGLPFNIMEAMASGLPAVASRIKGHTDLLVGTQQSLLYDLGDENTLSKLLVMLYRNERMRELIGNENREIIQRYRVEEVKSIVTSVYDTLEKPNKIK